MRLRIATAIGLIECAAGGGANATTTVGGPVRVFGDVVIAGSRRVLWRHDTRWTELGEVPGILCAVDAPGGIIVGTEGAHLVRLGQGRLDQLEGFDQVIGRADWYTPWGAPPEVRSLACTPDNVLLANVHVGGIARSADGGRTWAPTVDIHDDVHQVRSVWGRADFVVAAAAVGLLVSNDAGLTWSAQARGLHATYCRAVAVPDQAILVSASEGPRGKQSAIYRTNIHATERFDRVTDWIDGNVDSHALDGSGAHAAFGTPKGDVYESTDAGATWTLTHNGLAPVTSLSLVP